MDSVSVKVVLRRVPVWSEVPSKGWVWLSGVLYITQMVTKV